MKQIIIILSIISYIYGHSYVTTPITRSNQRATQTGCRGPSCLGPCEIPVARANQVAKVTVQRGQQITVQWPRNNHAGGFIRFAWSIFLQSDSHAAFDGNVQLFQCHETGRPGVLDDSCRPSNPNDPNGGDSNPGSGDTGACNGTLTVPLHLTDGDWTLQWAWYGGAFALGDYYSCIDYTISGGPTGSKLNPVFKGSDYSNPNTQKCKYFNTDELHRCKNEPCENPKTPGQNAGRPLNNGAPVNDANNNTPAPPTPTSEAQEFCPNPNAPNLDGETLYPPRCGSAAPGARCSDGHCCSANGFCGPIKDTDGNYRENGQVVTYEQALSLYCTNNQGDWRLVPCNSGSVSLVFQFALFFGCLMMIIV